MEILDRYNHRKLSSNSHKNIFARKICYIIFQLRGHPISYFLYVNMFMRFTRFNGCLRNKLSRLIHSVASTVACNNF